MKNPVTLSSLAPDFGATQLSVRGSSMDPGLLNTLGVPPQPTADGKKKKDDAAESTLQFLKFSESDISAITSAVGVITTMASIASFSFAAVSTVSDLLNKLGILKKPDDPSLTLLKSINQKVQQIYAYLVNTEKRALYELAITWRVQVATLQNDLANLALARSASDIDSTIASLKSLAQAIGMMLDVGQGNIVLLRATYSWPPPEGTFLTAHWIKATTPFFMRKMDQSQPPFDYSDDSKDLVSQIWDPGFYFDVLLQAMQVRVAAVAGLEPAFRSTGYDRSNLHAMYNGLTAFIKQWEGSLIVTNVVGPIHPEPNPGYGGHVVADDPYWTRYAGGGAASIPLGCVDPLTGTSSLDSVWGAYYPEKAVMMGRPLPFALGGSWVTDNYDGVVPLANAALEIKCSEVRAACGISQLYDLSRNLWNLVVGVGGSEFVTLSDARFFGVTFEQSQRSKNWTLELLVHLQERTLSIRRSGIIKIFRRNSAFQWRVGLTLPGRSWVIESSFLLELRTPHGKYC
jgi:hypothetical protein